MQIQYFLLLIIILLHFTTTRPMQHDTIETSLIDIPDEILLVIVSHVNTYDTLNVALPLLEISKHFYKQILPFLNNLVKSLKISPMHIAAIKNDLSKIIELKHKYISPLVYDANHQLPIDYAKKLNNKRACKLLSLASHKRKTDDNSCTKPLHSTINAKNYYLTLKLLAKDNSLNTFTIREHAKQHSTKEIIALLSYDYQCRQEANLFNNIKASHNPDTQFFENFKTIKANPNAYDKFQYTPLQRACIKDTFVKTVKELLEITEIDIDHIHPLFKKNALMIASFSNASQCLEVLLKTKKNKKLPFSSFDQLALHEATANNNVKCVRLLLDYGADHTFLDENKKTALNIAEEKNHNECYEMLENHAQQVTVSK